MIAHVGGLPIEEVVPLLLSGGGAFVLLRLRTLRMRRRPLRRRRAGRAAGAEGTTSRRPIAG
ncbi:MAG: hypothetical protein S0880_21300 [Actinomycetota bacterium]|nr:hypothetical protein [Actinomycetota bacterium]